MIPAKADAVKVIAEQHLDDLITFTNAIMNFRNLSA